MFKRRHRQNIARSSAGLFAVVWLGMAAQPCVMALEALSEGGHGSQCPHCPDVEHPCHDAGDTPSRQCGFVASYDFDGRTPDVPKAAAPDQHLILLALESTIGNINRQNCKIPRSLDAESPPGRYTLQFCVFLK